METTALLHRVPDACRRMGIGRSKLYQLIGEGKLHTVKIGARVLVPEAELQRLLAELSASRVAA